METLSPFMHVKRARSVALAVVGAMYAVKWTVAEIGRGMARARGVSPKHAIKQFDRLLSNEGFDLNDAFRASVGFLLGGRKKIVVAIDWTDFDADDQSTVSINLITLHGRATPLVWKTFRKSDIRDNRNSHEDEVLYLLRDALPKGVNVIVLADRGFGSVDFYAHLKEYLGWDFVVRFRGDVKVYVDGGVVKAAELVQRGRNIIDLPSAKITNKQFAIRVVATHQAEMKDAWFLATSLKLAKSAIVRLYGRRFTIEESFRDLKDNRFGFALSQATIGTPERRDRILFVISLAVALMTFIGGAAEIVGADRKIHANTVRSKRTHSLLRQAHELLFGALRSVWKLIREQFERLLAAHKHQGPIYGII